MVGQLRATTFIPNLTADDTTKKSWWDQVVGEDPVTGEIDYQRNLQTLRGPINDNSLIMIHQPERIDWILEATLDKAQGPMPPTLGSMSDRTLEPLVKIVKNWLGICPRTYRLAFGAIIVKQTDNVQTGCEEIQPYLPNVKLNPKGTSDFSYKINRPKKSSVKPNVTINRVNEWSIEVSSNLGITMGSSRKAVVSTNIQNLHLCKLGLDINTAIQDSLISGDEATEIFQELIRHGQEIAKKGDV